MIATIKSLDNVHPTVEFSNYLCMRFDLELSHGSVIVDNKLLFNVLDSGLRTVADFKFVKESRAEQDLTLPVVSSHGYDVLVASLVRIARRLLPATLETDLLLWRKAQRARFDDSNTPIPIPSWNRHQFVHEPIVLDVTHETLD
jgi:hypothetical protein